MQDKLELIEITLEIIQRVTMRVDALYSGPGNAAKQIFARLLGLCRALDSWIDVELPTQNDIPTPRHLRDKAFKVAVDLLRYLASNIHPTGEPDEPMWVKILRIVLIECLEVVQGMWFGSSNLTVLTIYRFCISPQSSQVAFCRDALQ